MTTFAQHENAKIYLYRPLKSFRPSMSGVRGTLTCHSPFGYEQDKNEDPIAYVTSLLGRRFSVWLYDGRVLYGTFRSFDNTGNLILSDIPVEFTGSVRKNVGDWVSIPISLIRAISASKAPYSTIPVESQPAKSQTDNRTSGNRGSRGRGRR